MHSSSHKLIAIVLTVLFILSPFNGVMANFTGSSSGIGAAHEMMMNNTSGDLASNASSGMSEDCQHCKSGQCDIDSVCYAGSCFSTTAAMLTSSFFMREGNNIINPVDDSHIASITPASLFRPPRH